MDVAESITAARVCIGTPFVAQGRLPGVGLDCAGLVLHALRAGGQPIDDVAGYAIPPAPDLLLTALTQNFHTHPTIIPGAILLFRFQGRAQHLALATSHATMIHAFAPAGRVVETDIGPAWLPRLLGIYSPYNQLPAQ